MRNISYPQEGVLEAARDESYFHPEAVLFGRKKETKDERTNIGNFQ